MLVASSPSRSLDASLLFAGAFGGVEAESGPKMLTPLPTRLWHLPIVISLPSLMPTTDQLNSIESQFPVHGSLRLQMVKINYDGAVFMEDGEGVSGAIAHDCHKRCLALVAIRFPHCMVVELAEAWAAREAIDLALRHGWRWS